MLEQARAAVEYGAGRVDEIEFSAEDATRSDPEFLAEVCRAAIHAGATTIDLPDTVGYCLPAEYAGFLTEVRRAAPSSTRSSSPSTATTTSGSRPRTRWRESPPAPRRSSAP